MSCITCFCSLLNFTPHLECTLNVTCQHFVQNLHVIFLNAIPNYVTIEPLLGGPCSLLLSHFFPLLLAPFSFPPFAPFHFFHCSFLIFMCSMLLFNFSPCSRIFFMFHAPFWNFTLLNASFYLFSVLLAPGLSSVCSLLLYLFYGLLLAPLSQTGLASCSGIIPNRGSLLEVKLGPSRHKKSRDRYLNFKR